MFSRIAIALPLIGLFSVATASEGAIASANYAEVPLFVARSSSVSFSAASVRKILSAPQADLVLLDAGYNRNIRPGMICLVERQGRALASISIVESTAEKAIGFILSQGFMAPIQIGDTITINTVHFN